MTQDTTPTSGAAAPAGATEMENLQRTAVGWQERALRAERNWVVCRRWAIAGGAPVEKLGDDPDQPFHAALAAGQATAQQAVVPAGWKLVPVDATDEMVRATDEVNVENGDTDGTIHNVWHVMIAAAPAQPAAQQVAAYAALPESFLEIPDVQDESGINAYYSREVVLECIDAALASHGKAPTDAAPSAGAVAGPDDIDAIALTRYKVVPAHESMFHRFAVVAGDGKQQLYLGREVECENMARKFAGAFLDGAFYQANITTSTQAAGSVLAVEREQERIAFKDAHRHLELDEVPDAWGRPMFKHSHIEASWLGWIARASHGQAPAGEAILFEHEDGRYAINPDTTGDPAWHRLGHVELSVIAAPAQSGLTDAYVGAREDLSIWKRRALEAEATVRNFVREANSPTFMGDPASDECHHGDAYIVNDCLRCGAPVCCGKCCAAEATHSPQAAQQAPAGVTLRSMIEGMSVSVDVSTGDHDAGHRYFGTVTEVMECQGDKHGVTLLVQDAEPNFTATPTAPSTPSSTAKQASAHVLHLVQDAFAEVAMAYPKAFALHKVGLADTAVRKALAAYTPQAADSVQEDAARLDWLDQQCECYGFQDIHEGNRWEISGPYANVRQAIDYERAARKQGATQ